MVPGIGWAFGIERLLLALAAEGVALPAAAGPLLYLAAMDEAQVAFAARVAIGARTAARVEFAYRPQKPGNAFRDAERRRARYAAVIGSDEAERGVLKLKHLGTGAVRDVALADLNTFLEQENA
jgi:histidyl-tRNA synthetase